jgi:hypothetical protein
VAREQAGGVTDRFGSRREGRAHQSGGFHGSANQAAGSDSGGAEEAMGAGKEVEGAPSVGAKLGVVSGGSEGDRGSVSRRHDGVVAEKGQRRKRAAHRKVCSFYRR